MRPSGLAFLALFVLAVPASAQTVCTDGSASTATGRGACSAHGGVDAAATAKAKRASRATKAGPITYKPRVTAVTCADGSSSAGGQGACSHHGGVASVTTRTTTRTTTAPPMSLPMPAPRPEPTTPRMSPTPRPSPQPAPRTRTSNSPAGASAQCRDGSYSYSATRKGTCSHHGGVSAWIGLAN